MKCFNDMGYHERTYRPRNRKYSEINRLAGRFFHIWRKRLMLKAFDLNADLPSLAILHKKASHPGGFFCFWCSCRTMRFYFSVRTECHYVKLTFSSLPKSWIPWLFQVLLRHITNKKLRNEVKTRKQYPRSPKCSHRSQLTGYLRYLPLGLCNEPHHSLVY